ncbi:hypothetical protein CJF30_00008739 [Rutstroemia sp. NJR-2017a BBW]|nr:hypothetical protein CJF30_00008739 [Rutstroemia sp. NJR-2017a BBW]
MSLTILKLPSSLLLLAFLATANAQKQNGEECTCFRTNGHSSGYFTSHRFHDFRNVQSGGDIPDLITDATNSSLVGATSDFFLGDAWTSDWTIQSWTNADSRADSDATVLMVNSPNNVYIETSTDNDSSYSTYLTLRTARLADFQSAAEFDSTEQNFHHLSARFLARVTGSAGACAGLFTYLSSSPVQEADIEILTSGPRNRVQYTNQPSLNKHGDVETKATVNGTQDLDWSEWNIYRMDWMPKMTSWYVNGISVANISYHTPKDPAGLIINMWGDGGSWTGEMEEFDRAMLNIQWMEVAFNVSGDYGGKSKRGVDGEERMGWVERRGLEKRKSKGCEVVCSLDEDVNVTGTPALLYNNTGMGVLGWKEGTGAMGWLPVLVVGLVGFGWL